MRKALRRAPAPWVRAQGRVRVPSAGPVPRTVREDNGPELAATAPPIATLPGPVPLAVRVTTASRPGAVIAAVRPRCDAGSAIPSHPETPFVPGAQSGGGALGRVREKARRAGAACRDWACPDPR